MSDIKFFEKTIKATRHSKPTVTDLPPLSSTDWTCPISSVTRRPFTALSSRDLILGPEFRGDGAGTVPRDPSVYYKG